MKSFIQFINAKFLSVILYFVVAAVGFVIFLVLLGPLTFVPEEDLPFIDITCPARLSKSSKNIASAVVSNPFSERYKADFAMTYRPHFADPFDRAETCLSEQVDLAPGESETFICEFPVEESFDGMFQIRANLTRDFVDTSTCMAQTGIISDSVIYYFYYAAPIIYGLGVIIGLLLWFRKWKNTESQ